MTNVATTSAILLTLVALAACSDAPSTAAPASPAEPGQPASGIARLHGTVDVVAGTMTFEGQGTGAALSSGSPDAQVYGNQGVTVRIYNSAVATGAPSAGKKTYTANVGVRNLLAYRIGDEQKGPAPTDTMGIYVFVNTGPSVSATSSPCPTCTVTVKNARGLLNFNGTNQAYWFYPEFLDAANGGADTTRVRQTWIFEADTAVTRFNFDVLVSAPWVAPNETSWKIEFPGDSLPDTQAEPKWKKSATSMSSATLVGGNLELDLRRTKDSLVYFRNDSVSSAMDALVEARFRLDDGGGNAAPQPGIALDDEIRYIGVFLSDSNATGRGKVGFVDATGAFLAIAGATDTVSVRAFRIYQLRKYGADSAAVYVDGVRRLKVSYAALPATKSAPSSIMFGFTNGVARTTTTTWDYVLYQLGKATP